MSMTANDIVNYYLQNPPFEVTDDIKYQSAVTFATEQTLLELSENDPVLDEKEFTTPESDNKYVLVDIYETIDERWMSFIILTPKNNIPVYYQNIMLSFPISIAFKEGSLVDWYAVSDSLYKLKEITDTYVQKLIFQGRKIKLLSNTEYYTLYYRYKTLDEVTQDELDAFRQLLEINIMLTVYQSSIFTSEQGIRSVSISGLSVSLNVPSTESIQRTLVEKKKQILSQIALTDYTDMIGHW